MFEYYQCPVIRTCPPRRKRFIDPTDTPYHETPYPETPYPETPYPETPIPGTPYPRTPYPETPYPRTPYPVTPYPKTPYSETPIPRTPYPKTPIPCSCKYSETVSIPTKKRDGQNSYKTVVYDYNSTDEKECCEKANKCCSI